MTNRIRKGILPLAIASLLAASPLVMAQNVTSSAVTGQIVNSAGQPIAGATVKIVHVPSGTTKIVTTNAEGRYNAKGMRVGGPYDITVTKPGLAENERSGVFLQLGQTSAINLILQPSSANAKQLGAVTVTANALSSIFSPENKGMSTNISQRELNAMPTPGRSIEDVVRTDPQIVIVDRSEGKISAVGQNYRYNNITVDSVAANDPFGLNANGLPITGTPISQDTIAEYNISTADYDVTNRRGLGANINAVTKSGTNEFHGSVYYVFEDHNWIGDKVDGVDSKFSDFDREWTAGATVGGPIVKDKLFFFLSYEKSETIGAGTDSGPEGSGKAIIVNGMTQQDVQSVHDAAATYGLTNIGSFTGGGVNLQDKRYLAKIDWNITDNHRLSFTWRRAKEFEPEIFSGSTTGLTLSSGWIAKNTDSKSYALHLYDDWSEDFSSTTTLSYAHYHRVGGPYNGVDMPDITVHIGSDFQGPDYKAPTIEFGTNYSYMANMIDTKTMFASWVGSLFLNNHTVKFGFDYERDQKDNLFLQDYFGEYNFDSLQDFIDGDYFTYYYKRPADGLGLNDVSALFTVKQWGVFVQDTWQVNDNLSLQYGLRLDVPKTGDKPIYNPLFAAAGFTTSTGDVLTTNQYTVDNKRVVQPRVSFNYSFDTQRMSQLRGGFGLFITNPPAVWIGNIYSNAGPNVVSYTCGPTQRNCNSKTGLPAFSPDPHQQNDGTAGSAAQTVNTVDPNFHLPSAWKFTLGYDAELPWWGLIGTINYMHIAQRDAIWYQALNLGAPTGTLPDGRNTYYHLPDAYPRAKGQYANANANTAFTNSTINLADTSIGKTDSFTVQLRKPFNDNWSAKVAVTYSHTTDVNPGLSSVASSSYKQQMVTNPNENVGSISNYNIPLRAIASIEWRHAFFGHYYTRISAFWDGHDGHPYSWTFGNDANGDSFINDLVYIPREGDVEFASGTDPQRIQQFYDYIKSNSNLREHAGHIAQRNADRAPWFSQVDLSISQEIPGLFRNNKGQIRLDVYNFLNIFNSRWGVEKRADFPGVRNLADFDGVDPTTGKYIYDISGSGYSDKNGNYQPETVPPYDDFIFGTLAQRWGLQLTVRYTF